QDLARIGEQFVVGFGWLEPMEVEAHGGILARLGRRGPSAVRAEAHLAVGDNTRSPEKCNRAALGRGKTSGRPPNRSRKKGHTPVPQFFERRLAWPSTYPL